MKDSLICPHRVNISGIIFFLNLVCHFAKKEERKPVMVLFLTAVENLELGRLKAQS